uniref:MerR family transcriptional regulator n=1 Tax=Streptomyces sp. CHD11 TaxID=2741325 RepID=UPI001BFC444F|nr:MerR family transcriptional regulator [Streptomyces sp. CHD11]
MGRVAGLAGVSVRTLHHYDEIGLVRPSARTPAGYRAYSAGDVERLREVLAYRRLGFGLREVGELVGDPSTDAVAHLRRLRGLLLARRDRAEPVPVPWDCADGLFEAYWRRPEAYLQDHVRRAVSVWTRVGPQAEQRAVRRLGDDLGSGRWAERNSDLAGLDAADLGLRLLVA